MKQTIKNISIALIISILSAASAFAIDNKYRMEIGLQAGANYYIGDANPHIFMHPREAAGLQLRYKFDRRWSLTGKANWSRFGYEWSDKSAGNVPSGWGGHDSLCVRPLIAADVVAEFNFFEYGNDWEMGRIKPYTPYIFLGVGVGCYGKQNDTNLGIPASLYFPFGLGFKWKFAPRWGLNVAWQHNLYFKDNLEHFAPLNNTHDMNGSNILECDLTGQFMVGIVFDFLKSKRPCTTCNYFN